MSESVREEKEFLLTVFGANPALRTIVVSLCKLYRYRDRSYRVIDRSDYKNVNIAIVDADDVEALAQWHDANNAQSAGSSKPAILMAPSSRSRSKWPMVGSIG